MIVSAAEKAGIDHGNHRTIWVHPELYEQRVASVAVRLASYTTRTQVQLLERDQHNTPPDHDRVLTEMSYLSLIPAGGSALMGRGGAANSPMRTGPPNTVGGLYVVRSIT